MLFIPEFCQMDKLAGIISKDKNANMVARGGDRILVRCCIVGDAMVGKTTAVKAFTGGETKEYSPTIFENYAGAIVTEEEEFTISVFDLSGQHDHEELRAFAYSDCQAFVVCYSAVDRITYQNVKEFWVPEIRKHVSKKRPIIVVATQCNLRNTTSYDMDEPVSTQEGECLAKDVEASCFLEIPSSSDENAESVFRHVVIQTQKQRKKRSRSTKILQKVLRRT